MRWRPILSLASNNGFLADITEFWSHHEVSLHAYFWLRGSLTAPVFRKFVVFCQIPTLLGDLIRLNSRLSS